jgi:hypothetical protein
VVMYLPLTSFQPGIIQVRGLGSCYRTQAIVQVDAVTNQYISKVKLIKPKERVKLELVIDTD